MHASVVISSDEKFLQHLCKALMEVQKTYSNVT